MNHPENIKCSKRHYNSDFAIEHSMQQLWGGYVSPFLGLCSIYQLVDILSAKKETAPYCCIFDFSTSTKHCVVQGSGQDRELEVEQSIRTATERKEQTYTNLGFNPLSSEAVQNVLCSHWSAFRPISVSSSSWTEITLTYNP